MKKIRNLLIMIMSLSLTPMIGQDLIIEHVNVVDVETGELLRNQNVSVREGKITRIQAKPIGPEENVRTIDGSGKYLLPGFIDSHAHISMGPVSLEYEEGKPVLVLSPDEELKNKSLELLLKFGVTSVRDPGGNTEIMVSTKRAVNQKKIAGPELFVAGHVIDKIEFRNLTTKVTSIAEIQEEVRRQKRAGVDIIKLYTSLSPAMIKAGIDEAHKQGLLSTAHLHSTSWKEAAELGIDNIVHIIPGNEYGLPESKKDEYHGISAFGTKAFFKWFELVDLDGPEIKEMIAALKRNNVSIDPTLVPFHAAFFGDTGEYQSNELLSELPDAMLENWKTIFNFNIGWTPEDFKIAKKAWPKVQRFTRMLYENGILLTAGTDANNPWTVPGDSFHRELVLLNKCGIPAADVLKMATINGAKIVRADARIGSIKVGKEADLVLLDHNPLEDIRHTRAINMVIVDGVVVRDNEE